MKTLINFISVVLFLTISNLIFAQTEQNPNTIIKTNIDSKQQTIQTTKISEVYDNSDDTVTHIEKAYSIGSDGIQHLHDKAYFQEQLNSVDYMLQAIDDKINYVNSNPEEKTIATQNGWFQQMQDNKIELQSKRAELIQKIESFNN
jgi:uncharacterized membrane protein